ncbi:ABC transporter permease [Paenibacillus sp. KN14-4R]|uniref:ABC transporter permease n=1 Tax=Paenibacillus sp. KN14-4R TaxID=3445773 RepID=UPI003FA0F771
MVNLLYCEILKLKRSKMFLISILGSIVAPLMCFVGSIKAKLDDPGKIITYDNMFSETNLYTLLVFGIVVYGVIVAYLFCREYTEKTLKSMLTIPVSKVKFMLGKFIMLFGWIILLTLLSWVLTLFLCLVGPIEGGGSALVADYLIQFLLGGTFMFLALTPFVFLTLWLKNIVPPIIAAATITMVNAAISNKDISALFPWTAVYNIATGGTIPDYPLAYSYLIVIAVSVIGFMASLIYFKKTDVH